jgi:hypothetical protein
MTTTARDVYVVGLRNAHAMESRPENLWSDNPSAWVTIPTFKPR